MNFNSFFKMIIASITAGIEIKAPPKPNPAKPNIIIDNFCGKKFDGPKN